MRGIDIRALIRGVGCLGSPDIKTPQFDRLAAGDVRLTSFHVTLTESRDRRSRRIHLRLITGCGP